MIPVPSWPVTVARRSVRILSALLMVCGLACLAFAWWGLETVAGRRSFDEMDGIIPFAAAALGVALLIAALFLIGLRSVRARLR